MDNELFELCKEVYKRFPEWKIEDFDYGYMAMDEGDPVPTPLYFYGMDADYLAPVYDTDYLLEKLPKEIDGYPLQLASYGGWTAKLTYDTHDTIAHYQGVSDTPLKALLKLVIALDDDGVKL